MAIWTELIEELLAGKDGVKPLAAGTYKVIWHATDADTHKTQGSYRFTVKP
jgi:methionine-rich copper-binding protein CopC